MLRTERIVWHNDYIIALIEGNFNDKNSKGEAKIKTFVQVQTVEAIGVESY